MELKQGLDWKRNEKTGEFDRYLLKCKYVPEGSRSAVQKKKAANEKRGPRAGSERYPTYRLSVLFPKQSEYIKVYCILVPQPLENYL